MDENRYKTPLRERFLLSLWFLIGVAFCITANIIVLEVLILYPPLPIDEHTAQHIYDFEILRQVQGTGMESIIEAVVFKFDFYLLLMKINWVLWFIPISIAIIISFLILAQHNKIAIKHERSQKEYFKDNYYEESRERKRAEEGLSSEEEHMLSVHDGLHEGFISVGKDERILHVNPAAKELFYGWESYAKELSHMEGQMLKDLMPDYAASGLNLTVQEAMVQELTVQKEIFLESVDTWLHVRLFSSAKGVYLYISDITEKKNPKSVLKDSEVILKSMTMSVDQAVAVVDRQWNYIITSSKWLSDFQLGTETLEGKNHKDVLPQFPGKWSALERNLSIGKSVKSNAGAYIIRGQEEWLSWEVKPWIIKGKISGYIIYSKIITAERQRASQELQQRERERKLAYHDILTGLPNRQLFYDRLTMALAQSYRQLAKVGLFFLDLDGFKAINDNLGHDIGDMLLKGVAERLKECVRDSDTVARLGGDEFTIILTGINGAKDAEVVAKKVIAAIARPFELAGETVQVSTSVGISLYPHDGGSTTELIKKADTAMYWSKESGKNTYRFFTESQFEAERSMTGANGFKEQLEHAADRNELELFFQPQYNLASNQVFGMEALLRWKHPEMGVLTPDKFLDLAEKTKLIIPIGEWVIRSACEKNQDWLRDGYDGMNVSVNLSKVQLADEHLVKRIADILAETDMDPSKFGIEISEEVIKDHDEAVVNKLEKLKIMGINIIVDDYGLGFTPMEHLRKFPITMIKIHRSFIHRACSSVDSQAIIKAVITLAHNLGLDVMGEGVESQEQADFLIANGCDNVQGFYFGAPVEPVQVIDYFKPLAPGNILPDDEELEEGQDKYS